MFKIISYIILAAINIFTVYDNNFIINYINNILINTNTQKYNLTNKAINFIIKLKTERKYQLLIENIENKNEDFFVFSFIDYNHTYNNVNFFRNSGFKKNKYNFF